MKRKQLIAEEERLRNNRFAEAFDELKRNHGITTQVQLAKRMGVNKDTITNILNYYTPVTEDIITKLQTASGCIFNLQFLRGESEVMLVGKNNLENYGTTLNNIEPSSMINAMLAFKDETIESMKRELSSLNRELATKDVLIASLQQQVADLRTVLFQKSAEKISDYPFPLGVADPSERPEPPSI